MSFGFHYCPAQISETDLEGEKLVDVDRLWVASSRLEPIRSALGLSWHQRTLEEKIQRLPRRSINIITQRPAENMTQLADLSIHVIQRLRQ